MVYDGIINGKYIYLSAVSEEDAEFTRSIRQDPELTRYLPAVFNTLEEQIEWIKKQREKEGDFYFIAKDKSDKRVGTVGIYNIKGKEGEGGRLASIGNALQSIEIQLLILEFDFKVLNLDKVTTFVYAENGSALRLSKQFGIEFDCPELNAENIYICRGFVTKEKFYRHEKKVKSMLYRE